VRWYRLQEVTKTLQSVVEQAEKVTISESEHWFDNVTVSRHMKQMNEAYKVFEKTSTEMNSMQQRLESAYEDMGSVLNRYYKIGEALREDNLEITEAIAVVDGSDRKSKILKALLKQHRVTMKVINQAGSGGKNLKVKLTGSRKDLKAVLQSEEGWGINDVQNYIK
jgi:division protein CdvB (Snf7/Vps24/ESCRT-III family)